MDFRIDGVGALIFPAKEENKPTIDDLSKDIEELKNQVNDLRAEVSSLRKIIKEMKIKDS